MLDWIKTWLVGVIDPEALGAKVRAYHLECQVEMLKTQVTMLTTRAHMERRTSDDLWKKSSNLKHEIRTVIGMLETALED